MREMYGTERLRSLGDPEVVPLGDTTADEYLTQCIAVLIYDGAMDEACSVGEGALTGEASLLVPLMS